MRIFNRYILILVLTACVINGVLAFIGQTDLSVYFILNTIAYLMVTLLHVYLNPAARRALNGVAVVLFAGFMVIVIVKVVEILS